MKYILEFIQKLIRSSTHQFLRYFADKIVSIIFKRAITQERGIILLRKKKIRVSYFFMRNPYKKLHNSSMHVSKVMLCIKKYDEQLDG